MFTYTYGQAYIVVKGGCYELTAKGYFVNNKVRV
jgi:hypothetical protein